ncbi:MAG: PaaI family thioesterase [Streptosporangiaceae bacterium]
MQQTDLPPSQSAVREAFGRRDYCWDDPAITAALARDMPGKAFLEAIADGSLPAPPVARTLDFALVSVGAGTAVFEFAPADFHYNPIGSVHGGVLSTLCDSACGCAVQTMLPAGTYYTSLDLSVKFLRPVTADTGRLLCEGSVTHLGGRSALAEARLTGPDGKLYAHATSSCMVFRPPAG